VLVTGISQKPASNPNNTAVAAGAFFYRIRIDKKIGATPGVVFDGAALGPKFLGLMRDRAGTDVAVSTDFKIGRLELF
jgi:hypothetical protein